MRKINLIITVSILLMLFAPMISMAATGNDSLKPSARRGADNLPQPVTDGVNGVVDIIMYGVTRVAMIGAIIAASVAFFSKDRNKKNEGLLWLGYIIITSLVLGIVFSIIGATLFT
jgi:hypothetical protein